MVILWERQEYKFREMGVNNNLGMSVGDALLMPPELALDGLVQFFNLFYTHPQINSADYRPTMVSQIFEMDAQPVRNHLYTIFMDNLAARELKYFGNISNSEIYTTGVQDGWAEPDSSIFMRDQSKIMWDVTKNTYFSKYKLKLEDRIRDQAFYVTEWRGADFVVVPPLLGAYLYYRGIDKRFKFGGIEIYTSIEPLNTLFKANSLTFSLEVGVPEFPIKFVTSDGMLDNHFNSRFVGIGSSISAMKQLIRNLEESRR